MYKLKSKIMKSTSSILLLFYCSFFFLIGCKKTVDERCSLPRSSEWQFADGDISFKVRGDSLYWEINSDISGISSLEASTKYQLFQSGKILLQSHLPLLAQDLSYIYGEQVAEVFNGTSCAHRYKLKGNKLTFYSSNNDSIIFYRKK